MPVSQFMSLCLSDPTHGYYMTRDPLGRSGDFITSPEVSQMFGELIGIWCASVWRMMGSPENVRLIELGPGRGTMMLDILRAARVVPEFRNAVVVHMVEVSPALQARQKQTLGGIDVPVLWHNAFEDVPEGPHAVTLSGAGLTTVSTEETIEKGKKLTKGKLAYVLSADARRRSDPDPNPIRGSISL